jgi:hypothetical protein
MATMSSDWQSTAIECQVCDDEGFPGGCTRCGRELTMSPQRPFDAQVGGDHYRRLAIQPTDFIHKNNLGFIQGNIIKYVVRYKEKGGREDLLKARHYLDMLIEQES